MKRECIQVVGGGFSGLSVAYFLAREGFSVRVVDENPHLGGLLQTHSSPYGLVEKAANAIVCNSLVEETATELGIELETTLPSARKRFIYRNGKPRRWPLSPKATLRLLGLTAPRFLFNRESFLPEAQESVKEWGYRNLGPEATEYLLLPGMSGIYAGRGEDLSATLILNRLVTGKPRIPKGRLRGSVAPKRGMGEWARGFRLWLELHSMEIAHEAKDGLRTVVALPPHRASQFLNVRAPVLAAQLRKIEMLSLVSVTCFLPANSPGLDGFGCLFPRGEGIRPLGVLANDKIFPGRVSRGGHSETWIFGGAIDREAVALSDEELLQAIKEARSVIHGGSGGPISHFEISRSPEAIPHYGFSLEATNFPPEGNYIPFGTYLGDLGLGRVLLRAQKLARSLH